MRYMINTSILSAISKDVLRNVCVGRCLIPTKAKANPEIMRSAPATPSAGVITGWIGSWLGSSSEASGIVAFEPFVAVPVGSGTAVIAEVTSPSPSPSPFVCEGVVVLSLSFVLVADSVLVGVDVRVA